MNKLDKRIDNWEERTHVYVAFVKSDPHVHLEGIFYDEDLADIASILRKMRKQAKQKVPKSKQLALLDIERKEKNDEQRRNFQ